VTSSTQDVSRTIIACTAALVVALLFVGLQVRNSNALAELAFQSDLSTQALSIESMAVEQSGHAKLLVKLKAQSGTLSKAEYEQARAFALVRIHHWLSVERAREEGWISEEELATADRRMAYALKRYPGLRQVVKERLSETGLEAENASGFVARIYEEIGKYL